MDLQQALIDLYISLKEKALIQHQDHFPLDLEPIKLVSHIKSYVNIAINVQVEKALQVEDNGASESLEKLTQDLEAEIRSHIRVN